MALQKGDRIKLRFEASRIKLLRAWQIGQIEARLESHRESFILISADYWQEYEVIFTVEIVNPLTAQGTIIEEQNIVKYILAANPWGYALIFKKSVIDPIAGKIKAAASWTPLVIAGVCIVAFFILPKK